MVVVEMTSAAVQRASCRSGNVNASLGFRAAKGGAWRDPRWIGGDVSEDDLQADLEQAVRVSVARRRRRRFEGRSDIELAWVDGKELIELQGRQLLRRVLDKALAELDTQFTAALDRGEVLELDRGKDDLRALLLAAAKKELAPPRKSRALPAASDGG